MTGKLIERIAKLRRKVRRLRAQHERYAKAMHREVSHAQIEETGAKVALQHAEAALTAKSAELEEWRAGSAAMRGMRVRMRRTGAIRFVDGYYMGSGWAVAGDDIRYPTLADLMNEYDRVPVEETPAPAPQNCAASMTVRHRDTGQIATACQWQEVRTWWAVGDHCRYATMEDVLSDYEAVPPEPSQEPPLGAPGEQGWQKT